MVHTLTRVSVGHATLVAIERCGVDGGSGVYGRHFLEISPIFFSSWRRERVKILPGGTRQGGQPNQDKPGGTGAANFDYSEFPEVAAHVKSNIRVFDYT